jgi:hypothetical protein
MKAIVQIVGNRPGAEPLQAAANAASRQENTLEQKVRAGIPCNRNQQQLLRLGEQQAETLAKTGP